MKILNIFQSVHKKVKWSFIENILVKEAWKRHKKLELEDKKRREKLELEKKIRSFIRKPSESYSRVEQTMVEYMYHVSCFAEHSFLNTDKKSTALHHICKTSVKCQ